RMGVSGRCAERGVDLSAVYGAAGGWTRAAGRCVFVDTYPRRADTGADGGGCRTHGRPRLKRLALYRLAVGTGRAGDMASRVGGGVRHGDAAVQRAGTRPDGAGVARTRRTR